MHPKPREWAPHRWEGEKIWSKIKTELRTSLFSVCVNVLRGNKNNWEVLHWKINWSRHPTPDWWRLMRWTEVAVVNFTHTQCTRAWRTRVSELWHDARGTYRARGCILSQRFAKVSMREGKRSTTSRWIFNNTLFAGLRRICTLSTNFAFSKKKKRERAASWLF